VICLGVDIGTTHTKALALDVATGRTLALKTAPTPMRQDEHGQAHRATDVLEVVIELLTGVVDSLEDAEAVVALCAASVGEEVVLLDDEGQPIGDTIAWFDPRGTLEAEAFRRGPGADLALSQRWPPDATFSIFKLMWMRDHDPGAYGAAISWTDLGDYVLAGLGGDLVMDWSHASRAGAFHLIERAWDLDTTRAAGLDLAFPRLVPSGTVIGRLDPAIANRVSCPPDVVIVTGGHDHLCAAYGAGVRTSAELFLSAGTSEAHLALMDTPMSGVSGGRYRIDQGCYVDAGTYYAHINIHSGHYFRQWRGLLYGDMDEDAIYAEVAAVPAGSGGITFGLHEDLRHGRLNGVPYTAGRASLMRAILEGLARRSADIIDHLEQVSGSPYELILAAGHPTRVPFWRELRMTTYGRPMAGVDEPETAAFGAAVIAARAVDRTAAANLVAARTGWGTMGPGPAQGPG
jgi:sugar (pentulose or hexulose) kinase